MSREGRVHGNPRTFVDRLDMLYTSRHSEPRSPPSSSNAKSSIVRMYYMTHRDNYRLYYMPVTPIRPSIRYTEPSTSTNFLDTFHPCTWIVSKSGCSSRIGPILGISPARTAVLPSIRANLADAIVRAVQVIA